ncbi:MAG: hypothetical protein ACLSAC_25160 [Enterocloster bolteae]
MINTYRGLILVYLTICLPVAVWMLKGYFDNLPIEGRKPLWWMAVLHSGY